MHRRIANRFIEEFDLPKHHGYVWGRKRSGNPIRRQAERKGKTVIALEDGLLRSIGHGKHDRALSLCIDDLGIYYDSTTASRLEQLIPEAINNEQATRAKTIQEAWINNRLSKYNDALESPAPSDPFVLVVDQSAGDLSIRHGQADAQSFERMLASALRDWPNHRVVVKTHPDVAFGRKTGHFKRAQLNHPRITVSGDGGHPCGLLEQCSAVYVVTSQMGFEGLIWKKPVYTFGMPFYAGWGLTADAIKAPERRHGHTPSLEQLIHAALVRYPIYRHPESLGRCSAEVLITWMGAQRQTMLALPQHLEAFGFTPWKARQLKRFIPRAKGQTLRFRGRHAKPSRATQAAVVWGNRSSNGIEHSSIAKIRVEDGFIRSVGLGANLVSPQSWILDSSGIYYDCNHASDLETHLNATELTPEERAYARNLRARLQHDKISKYNLQGKNWPPPRSSESKPDLGAGPSG